jgi:hypothetical protein
MGKKDPESTLRKIRQRKNKKGMVIIVKNTCVL